MLGASYPSNLQSFTNSRRGWSKLVAYCFDANTFIEAKNRYYALDLCPAFWDWLDREAAAGNIICVRSIYDEMANGGDDLANWLRARNQHAWLARIDQENTQRAMQAVAAHVQARQPAYRPEAIARFLGSADPWLVSYAAAHGHTVVTHERPEPLATARVKIPDVCDALDVPWTNTFDAIRQLSACFDLRPAP